MSPDAVTTRPRAVVFAYHNVGVRALQVLIDSAFDIRLVVTHRDRPDEAIWFDSVAKLAARHDLPCIAPELGDAEGLVQRCRALEPDFLFSFYYRHMLPEDLLSIPRRGAFNLHGSLLPKFRGRAPVNWAILSGERETGATLHLMDAKPDHGAIVDQCAVAILPDETARQVFDNVTEAAATVLRRALPRLLDGTVTFTEQILSQGCYRGARRPEDGRIPAQATARQLHDLVRALAPPEYPGAFFEVRGQRFAIDRTRLVREGPGLVAGRATFALHESGGRMVFECVDGGEVEVLRARLAGAECSLPRFLSTFASGAVTPDA